MFSIITSPLAVLTAIFFGLEIKQAWKIYKPRHMLFNILSVVGMCIFVMDMPVENIETFRLWILGLVIFMNAVDLFHLPREAKTALLNFLEIGFLIGMFLIIVFSKNSV